MDDLSGLWEVIGEVAGSLPGLGEADQHKAARKVVRSLLERGWIRLYRTEGDEMHAVREAETTDILEHPASWEAHEGGMEYRIGATEAGEHAYAAGDVR